jgi:hypothetical protein
MRLSDFIILSEEEKKLAVLHEGVLVGKRRNNLSMVFLFHFGLFYVETFCNIETKSVQEFRIFDDTRPLLPYLEEISIDELLN